MYRFRDFVTCCFITCNPTSQIFTGDGVSGLHARGMQLNEGSLIDYIEAVGTPISGSGNTENPFIFDWVRGGLIELSVFNASQDNDVQNIQLPQYLSSDNISTEAVNTPTGATITITVDNTDGLELEYSLNGVDYQDTNSFSGITEGDYTIYVRDQYGCQKTKDITIPNYADGGIGVLAPYADLPSKSNSIRFARYVEWGNCSDYKNDENTLSCKHTNRSYNNNNCR